MVKNIPTPGEVVNHFAELQYDKITNQINVKYILKPSALLLQEKLQALVDAGKLTQEEMNELL